MEYSYPIQYYFTFSIFKNVQYQLFISHETIKKLQYSISSHCIGHVIGRGKNINRIKQQSNVICIKIHEAKHTKEKFIKIIDSSQQISIVMDMVQAITASSLNNNIYNNIIPISNQIYHHNNNYQQNEKVY